MILLISICVFALVTANPLLIIQDDNMTMNELVREARKIHHDMAIPIVLQDEISGFIAIGDHRMYQRCVYREIGNREVKSIIQQYPSLLKRCDHNQAKYSSCLLCGALFFVLFYPILDGIISCIQMRRLRSMSMVP